MHAHHHEDHRHHHHADDASHDHHHAHDHHHGSAPAKRLAIALVLTLSFMCVEAAVGWMSKSLALVADAGHMLSDAGALGLALVAQRIASRPRSPERTFGSRRAEVLAAFINGIALAVTAALIVREAIERLLTPSAIQSKWMLATAIAGLVVNLVSAAVLQSGHDHNTNTRAALAHVLSDAVGSIGAIGAAVLVMTLGWTRADPGISLLIAVLILWGAWRLVKETTAVLMEGAPSHLDVAGLEQTLREVPGVCDVHDLHAWTISDGFHAVTAHVVLNGTRHGVEVVTDAARTIRERYHIDHVTLQAEAPSPGLVQIRIPKKDKENTCANGRPGTNTS